MTRWNYILRRDGYLILHFYDLKTCERRVKVLNQLHGSTIKPGAYSSAMSERFRNDVPIHIDWIELCNLDGSRPPGNLDALWQSRRQDIEGAMQVCGERVVLRPKPVDTGVQRLLQHWKQHNRPAYSLENSSFNAATTPTGATATSAPVPVSTATSHAGGLGHSSDSAAPSISNSVGSDLRFAQYYSQQLPQAGIQPRDWILSKERATAFDRGTDMTRTLVNALTNAPEHDIVGLARPRLARPLVPLDATEHTLLPATVRITNEQIFAVQSSKDGTTTFGFGRKLALPPSDMSQSETNMHAISGGSGLLPSKRKRQISQDDFTGGELPAANKRMKAVNSISTNFGGRQITHMPMAIAEAPAARTTLVHDNSATARSTSRPLNTLQQSTEPGNASSVTALPPMPKISNFAPPKKTNCSDKEATSIAVKIAAANTTKMSTPNALDVFQGISHPLIGPGPNGDSGTGVELPDGQKIDSRMIMAGPGLEPDRIRSWAVRNRAASQRDGQKMTQVTLEFEGMGNAEVMIRKVWIPTRDLPEDFDDQAEKWWKMH
ncbi:hypothetical protein EJ03DRAFT_354570 [Teratosphaeria nubilosa]|uniref:Uncharacterized protein n=1 Tax=Teratosphaeria nubilosa TaxID=161662 RepID=A0A6G1KYW6_9PEZI|nr:hypothetical protein EJ03DRAFT_354570 [Teratosphaeria nubilosa]